MRGALPPSRSVRFLGLGRSEFVWTKVFLFGRTGACAWRFLRHRNYLRENFLRFLWGGERRARLENRDVGIYLFHRRRGKETQERGLCGVGDGAERRFPRKISSCVLGRAGIGGKVTMSDAGREEAEWR